MTAETPESFYTARTFDAVVTGHSLPALQTALDLVEVGLRVAIAPSASEADGVGDAHELFAEVAELDPEGTISAFMTRIAQPIEGTDAEPHAEASAMRLEPNPPLLRDTKGAWAPQAQPELLGIPAVPLAAQVIRLLGGGGAFRAYLDRFTPLLTIGKTRSIGALVKKRMGASVLRRLVQPQVFERFGASAHEVDAAIAAPGLNETLSRAGALSAAVLAYSDRNVARETGVVARGGTAALVSEATRKLELYGVTLLTEPIREAHQREDGWDLGTSGGKNLQARALVVDQGADPQPSPLQTETIGEVLPDSVRIHAEIDIDRPAWIERGQRALTLSGQWAVRTETEMHGSASATTDEARALVRCSSVLLPAGGFSADNGLQALHQELDAQLETLAVSKPDHAEWRVRVAAGPYTDVASKHSALETFRLLRTQHANLLPVGRALHGDDLSQSLQVAHSEAVALRRHLLGLDVEPD